MCVRVRVCVVVKRDIQESDEEAVRVKEQSILELGGLLAKTGQAAGNSTTSSRSCFISHKAVTVMSPYPSREVCKIPL